MFSLQFARRLMAAGLAVLLWGAAAAAAHAAEPPLTLDAAIHQAIERAPLLEARRAQSESARQEAARAGALPDPQLTVGVDNLAVQGPGAFTVGGDSMTMRTVGISQALPSRRKRQAERAMGHAQADLAASSEVATGLSIRQQVADAWISAWGAHREAMMLRSMRQAWAQDVAVAKARLRGGTGSAAEVLAARMESLDLENRLDEANAREAQARAGLARWLGSPIGQPLGDAPDFAVLPHDEASLLASLDRQGNLLGWPAREQAAEAALAAARADKRPEWSVGLSYGSRVRGLSDMVSLQVGVSLPLFTRNRQDRGISARAADLDAVRDERDDARRQQVEAIRSAWAQWESLGQQVRRHRDALLPLANDRVVLALAAYRGGGEIQPLLDARRDEIAHHTDYARMQAEYGRAWAALAYLLPTSETTP
ncbi:MAG: TolC family protein [Rhodanobacter sp.]|jgi:outer membrane protein TolC|uniref:TolC family protein n=2 Tax=unclassified Rhodanobacter TaxID=2621553 RepID=A0AB74UYJ8_9GAMM|nr:TolC family protein [Rhodanobacter sp.]MBN8947551.1 TolC family protein [Rhodanobacter sp.]OJW33951.1 MAG: transporter [Rhodanobacter sp. 67-28]